MRGRGGQAGLWEGGGVYRTWSPWPGCCAGGQDLGPGTPSRSTLPRRRNPPVPSPRRRRAGSWQLPGPPVASPAQPLTPVVCPNDRLALVSAGDQPRAWECTRRRQGKASQDRHRGPGLGATGSGPQADRAPARGLVTASTASGRRPQKHGQTALPPRSAPMHLLGRQRRCAQLTPYC